MSRVAAVWLRPRLNAISPGSSIFSGSFGRMVAGGIRVETVTARHRLEDAFLDLVRADS